MPLFKVFPVYVVVFLCSDWKCYSIGIVVLNLELACILSLQDVWFMNFFLAWGWPKLRSCATLVLFQRFLLESNQSCFYFLYWELILFKIIFLSYMSTAFYSQYFSYPSSAHGLRLPIRIVLAFDHDSNLRKFHIRIDRVYNQLSIWHNI